LLLSNLLTQRQLPGALRNHLGVQAVEALATLQRLLHAWLRMVAQQLQDAREVPPTRQRAVPRFQTLTELLENRWQFPAAIDVGMVQGRRPTLQRRQVMQWVQHLTAGQVAAFVPGHHLVGHDNLDALGVCFHRRRLKGAASRHAVTHVIATSRLVFIDLGRLINAGVKARGRQRPSTLTLKPLTDRLAVLSRDARLILQTASTQVGIQFGQVLLVRHWRGPAALQRLDAILHVRLLVAAGRHAKQRLEHVVAGQGSVTWMQLPLPAAEDRRRHRLGIVPPNFTRHAAEELQPLHHAFQDRFGSLARQSDGERTIRVRPDQHEHRYLLTPIGKIDVDVTEVRFQALARITRQWDKRLDVLPLGLADIAAHRIVTAGITMLIPQTFEDAPIRVSLLGRRLFIVGKNLLDDGMKGAELASHRLTRAGVWLWLRMGQYFTNLAS
jgi:hypothetical protein